MHAAALTRNRTRWLVLAAMCLGAATACAPFDGTEGRDLIARGDAVYKGLPEYPGGRQTEHDTSLAHETEGGPVIGGTTLYVFRLPATATVARVERFYTRRLRADGWRLRERLRGLPDHKAGPVLNFVRGRSRVSINLEGGYDRRLEVAVTAFATGP